MAYMAEYADKYLHDFVDIHNVTRTILPTRENSSKAIPNMHGEYYMGYKYAKKEIILECSIKSENREDYVEKIRELGYLLDVQEPQKLIISDSPNTYVYAVIEGDTQINKLYHTGKFDLRFVCYNPFEYSTEIKNTLDNEQVELSNKHILDIYNTGSVDTYPIITANFFEDAHFIQCDNGNGKAVLVGYPTDLDKPDKPPSEIVLNDDCTTLEGWNAVGSDVLDGDVKRVVDGNLTINQNGYAITCENYGQSGDGIVWHGGARRKNLSREVRDFKVEIKMEHSSGGDLAIISNNPPTPNQNTYKITAKISANMRKERSTSSEILKKIPRGTYVDISDISQKWGKVSYDGKIGYVGMSTVEKVIPVIAGADYVALITQNVRSGGGMKYKVIDKLPKDTPIKVSSINKKTDWCKMSFRKTNGKTVTGYVYMKNIKKKSSSKIIEPYADDVSSKETKEDRMGRVEVYAFDKNGRKLWKVLMRDSSSYYEYSEPELYIGNKLVLHDEKSTPNAKRITQLKDGKTVVKKVDSGSYGKWNKFDGKFTIERKTKDNKQLWSLKVEKMGTNGRVVEKLESINLSDDSYPTTNLANIVIWFGAFKDNIPVDVQNITDIKVTDIQDQDDSLDENITIFRAGDELVIDFDEQEVLLNGEDFLSNLDITSQFFSLPAGNSEIICRSDSKKTQVCAEFIERWI